MGVKISLVVCTYNRQKYLPGLLRSILEQRSPYDHFELVFVNNNSTDDTERIALEFADAHPELDFNYLREEKQGLSYARNSGYRAAKYPIVAYLDDDARPDPNYVHVLAEYFAKHQEVKAIGGRVYLEFEAEEPPWSSKYINTIYAYFDQGDRPFQIKKPKFPPGVNMAFRREVLEELGGFNVKLGRSLKNLMSGEEKDLMYRIYDRNYKVMYLPQAIVYHSVAPFRTEEKYVKKFGLGVGMSEYVRTKHIGNGAYYYRLLLELVKWAATIVLLLLYTLKGTPIKGWMLLKYRWWITLALLRGR